jgi:protein ImuA
MNNGAAAPVDNSVLHDLRRRIRALDGLGDGSGLPHGAEAVSLGVPALDAALPWGGLPRGALHEIAGPPGDGAGLGFAVAFLARMKIGRPMLWCRTRAVIADRGALYGPGLAAGGVAPRQVIFVTVARPADALWVMEEALRCDALAAVVGEGVAPGFTASRRLQLAARGGRALALLLPPGGTLPASSAALTRWHLAAANASPPRRAWRVVLQHCRGGRPTAWRVEWKDAALCGAVAVPLADGPLAQPAAASA